jgi:hypothetical protein
MDTGRSSQDHWSWFLYLMAMGGGSGLLLLSMASVRHGDGDRPRRWHPTLGWTGTGLAVLGTALVTMSLSYGPQAYLALGIDLVSASLSMATVYFGRRSLREGAASRWKECHTTASVCALAATIGGFVVGVLLVLR